jgi:hypothetical protein
MPPYGVRYRAAGRHIERRRTVMHCVVTACLRTATSRRVFLRSGLESQALYRRTVP